MSLFGVKCMEKKCLFCGKLYFKITKDSYWLKRKFCSKKCVIKNQKGKPSGMLGKKQSKKTKKIHSIQHLNELNPMWKGNKVGYNGLHLWVRRRLKQPKNCSSCNKITISLDLANISQKYKRDLTDWEWLCRRCHMLKDGRIIKLIKCKKR